MTKSELCYDVAVQHIPAQGYKMQFEATKEECAKIAKRLGLRALTSFQGKAEIKRGDLICGRLSFQAQGEQTSVVSLQPVALKVKDSIDLIFVEKEPEEASLEEIALIEQGVIHLGELFIQYLSLALPDYPRNEGEVFESREDATPSPFAVLKKL